MKTRLFTLLGTLLLLGSCAHYPVAQQSGKEDMAYLLFTSGKEYVGKTVTVTIDDATHFDAKVVKTSKSNRKGTQYGVSTGKKAIEVKQDGKTIYSKQIFLSTQETKIITLP